MPDTKTSLLPAAAAIGGTEPIAVVQAAALKQTTVAGLKPGLGLVKADVGLGSADNTTDAGKPVSTAAQTALNLKADLAGPTFTGVPAAPTAAAATSTTQLATTAFATTADNLKANIAGPTFTGVPAAPTAAVSTNTTQIATTAFVLANAGSPAIPWSPTLDSATTATVLSPIKLVRTSSGTPANGIGTGLEFETETTAGNNEIGSVIESVTTDVTAASEDFDLVFKTQAAGAAAAERVRVTSTGRLIVAAGGSAAAPALRIGSLEDGFYSTGTNIFFAASGTGIFYINSSGITSMAATYDLSDFRHIAGIKGNFSTSAAVGAAQSIRGQISELITLSTGGTTTDSAADLLPANSIILGVTAHVVTGIATATSWALGDATTSARFASANATLIAGTTTVGLNHQRGSVTTDAAGPTQGTAAKLRITTVGTPSAGQIRITLFYTQFIAPSG